MALPADTGRSWLAAPPPLRLDPDLDLEPPCLGEPALMPEVGTALGNSASYFIYSIIIIINYVDLIKFSFCWLINLLFI